jgi:hypothetical protein
LQVVTLRDNLLKAIIFGLCNKLRLTLFVKGNLDVHDSLHSCRIGGQLVWNGVNEIARERYPDLRLRIRHETWTRSDALLLASGRIPDELEARRLPLGAYSAPSQFSTTLFEATADVYVLSILPDLAAGLVRHRDAGFLLYAADCTTWPVEDRDWLRANFTAVPPLDAAASMANFTTIITRLRAKTSAPILIYNVSPVIPGDTTHCYQGLDETYSRRIRRFNLALTDLSEQTGISIIDVDTIIARAGADRLKLDAIHLAPEGYRLVAEEVLRVLDDLGLTAQ